MNTELETVELFVDEEGESGIQAISFVEFPAIEHDFVHLSEHRVELKTIDEDKRLVIGLALVPNKLIRRNNKGFIYNITFSDDTVRKASEKYLKSLKLHNTTTDHLTEVDGVYLTESWIVEDLKADKTALYGLNAPLGAWAVAMRVENDDVWARVKNGEFLGFSIEGIFTEKSFPDEHLAALEAISKLLEEHDN